LNAVRILHDERPAMLAVSEHTGKVLRRYPIVDVRQALIYTHVWVEDLDHGNRSKARALSSKAHWSVVYLFC
jgi:hypothetical protein